jgi:hypothetical protein
MLRPHLILFLFSSGLFKALTATNYPSTIQLLKLPHLWKAAETTAISHRRLLQIQDGGMLPRNFAKFSSLLLKGQRHEMVTGGFWYYFIRITGGSL